MSMKTVSPHPCQPAVVKESGFQIEPEGDIAVPGGLVLTPGGSILDSEMAMALSLSQRHQEEEEARRKQEEETLKRILELSLTEK